MLANVLIGKFSYLYVLRSFESDITFHIKQSDRYLLFLIFKYFVLHYQPCIRSIYETQSTPICRDYSCIIFPQICQNTVMFVFWRLMPKVKQTEAKCCKVSKIRTDSLHKNKWFLPCSVILCSTTHGWVSASIL